MFPSRSRSSTSLLLALAVTLATASCNTPPAFTSTPPLTANASAIYAYQALATGSPAPTFALISGPAGMTVDGATGAVLWTPTLDQVGAQPVTLRASNAAGSVDQSFTIDTQPLAPAFTSTPPLVANVNVAYVYEATAVGAPSPSFALLAGPEGMSVDPATGLTLWTPVEAQLGAQPVTIRAASSAGFADQSFTIDTQPEPPDTTPPTSPQNLRATDVTQTSYTMLWDAPPEGDVAGYRLFERSFSNRQGFYSWNLVADGLTATTYPLLKTQIRWTGIFMVRAFDGAGNESANSNPLASTFLTLPGISHPMVGTNERPAAVIGEHLMLIENVDSYPVEYLAGYEISTSGNPTPTVELISGPPGLYFDAAAYKVVWNPVTGDPGTQSVTLRATNSEGFADFTFSFEVHPAGTDLLAPSGSSIVSVASALGGCNVTWTKSSDAHGIAGYSIRGQRHWTSTPNAFGFVSYGDATSAFVNTVPAGTTGWTLYVSAFDAAGNYSYPNGGGTSCNPSW